MVMGAAVVVCVKIFSFSQEKHVVHLDILDKEECGLLAK